MQTNLQTRSGNRVVVTLDGKTLGMMQSVRMNDDYSPEPASGIGDIHVQEWVPTMARHNLSINMMVLNRKTLLDQGLIPENGDGVLNGLVMDIEVFGKDDGILLRKYRGCSYASGDLEVNKHAIIMQSGTFNCLDVAGTGST